MLLSNILSQERGWGRVMLAKGRHQMSPFVANVPKLSKLIAFLTSVKNATYSSTSKPGTRNEEQGINKD